MSVNDVLSVLSDETRRRILVTLRAGRISSGDLAVSLNMSPQALSYHLAKLKKAGLIYETRHKNFIYYEVNLTILDEAILWLTDLRGGNNENEKGSFLDTVPAFPGSDPGCPPLPAGSNPGPL